MILFPTIILQRTSLKTFLSSILSFNPHQFSPLLPHDPFFFFSSFFIASSLPSLLLFCIHLFPPSPSLPCPSAASSPAICRIGCLSAVWSRTPQQFQLKTSENLKSFDRAWNSPHHPLFSAVSFLPLWPSLFSWRWHGRLSRLAVSYQESRLTPNF